MKTVIFVAFLAGLVFGDLQQCDFDESNAEKLGQGGSRSDTGDDDTSTAQCMKDYQMVGCECESYEGRDDCDGAWIREDAKGTHCVAFNMRGGKGVVARPRCQRVMVTCSTSVTDMPSIGCPENYKLTGCTMHSSNRQELWQDPSNVGGRRPVSKRGADGPCPHAKVDVMVLIESSGTIGAAGYQALIDFTKRGIDLLDISEDTAHVGYVRYMSYGASGSLFIHDKTILKQRLDALAFVNQALVANTLEAIDGAVYDLGYYGRPDAGKVLVMMSSGVFANPSGVARAMANAWNAGIFVVAGGAGPNINPAGLDLLTPDFYRLNRVDLATPDEQDAMIEGAIIAGPTRCTGYCYTSPGCVSCKVQARCVRVEGFGIDPTPP